MRSNDPKRLATWAPKKSVAKYSPYMYAKIT